MHRFVLTICFLIIACGCEAKKKQTVSGEILYIQESMGWHTPIHSVIRKEDGSVCKVYGIWGSVGDSVTVTAEPYEQ